MARPLVVEFLKNHSLQELERMHGVCARASADGSKYGLNYDMLLSKPGDQLAGECRGMVIRPLVRISAGSEAPVGDVEVVAWPMSRFYNHGDPNAATVDWSDPNLDVFEKLDGTMIVMYWDAVPQVWHAGTRSVPEADLPICKEHVEIGNKTFSQLFWDAMRSTFEANRFLEASNFEEWVNSSFNKEVTYVFELTSPYNRVVVKYEDTKATLLAARHTASGEEMRIHVSSIGLPIIPRAKTWKISSASALEAFVNAADPATMEGAVVLDSKFNRLKMKNMAWVLSSRAKDLVTVSRRSALLAIIKGTIDDIIPLVSEDISKELMKMQEQFVTLCANMDAKFQQFFIEADSNRRRFAELVLTQDDCIPAPFFSMWKGRVPSTLGWFRSVAEAGKLSSQMLDNTLNHMGKTTS